MLPEQLMNELHHLDRPDKLRAIQLLINDLALEEEVNFVPGAQYEIWSPYDSAEAATILNKLLEEDAHKADNA